MENAFADLAQSPSLEDAVGPLKNSLVKSSLLNHKDKDVRLLVAVCATEILRVLAPRPPFSDNVFKVVMSSIHPFIYPEMIAVHDSHIDYL